MIKYGFICSLFFSIFTSFAANYPFPQNKVAFGIKAAAAASSDVQTAFQEWVSGYYEENGTEARIDFDTKSQTVSEGIGYGMLIMACMDNGQNNTRTKFDKLWSYYKKWRDNNGLMNWKIEGFSGVAGDGQNGATDADLDAAAALVLANRQWGDQSYLADARTLINAIWNCEVNGNKYLKPGDAWDSKKDPSYFSTGALELFKSVDTHDWSSVIANSFTLLKKTCNATTGLPPDWCSEDGNSLMGAFDAVRVPWRMAWAYSWYGQKDASDIASKMATWIRGAVNNDPTAIKAGYSLTGQASAGYSNATYTGALSCAGMTLADNQDWINKGFAATKNATANSYFNKTLQVLYLLLLSGNFPLMTGTEVAAHPSSVSVPANCRHAVIPLTSVAGKYISFNGRKMKYSVVSFQPMIQRK
jgi:endo-1,4-beta-D-glucanase Y